MQYLQIAVCGFSQRATVLDPVAVVRVTDTADVANAGPMYMTAHDAVKSTFSGMAGGGFLEARDVLIR
ncbi:MAG TPA: hypothetical protein VGA68_03185 [Woeseiaceae bacterium]|jgi:hypothetical protein